MGLKKLLVDKEKNNLTIILFFVILTTSLTIAVIILWEKVLLSPFYGWVDQRYPGIENADRRRLIQQRTEHFFISVTVDSIVVTLLLLLVRRQQRELSESEERYRLIFEHASDGIGVVSVPEYRIVQVNRKFCDILGCSPAELVDHDMREIALRNGDATASKSISSSVETRPEKSRNHKDEKPGLQEIPQETEQEIFGELYERLAAFIATSNSESIESELAFQSNAGLSVTASVSFSTLSTGRERLVVLIIRDLSDRKRLEVEKAEMQLRMVRNEKIAALGRVAAQVAHEVKNPLAGLRLYSLHLKSKVTGKLSEGEMDIINKIADGIGRLTETTEQILSFARPINLKLENVNLNNVIRDTNQLLEPQSSSNNLKVKLELAESIQSATLDEASIHAAIMNLMLNAIQAMPEGGTLTVKTEMESDVITVKISDTGKGMTQEQIKNVFEPFYTTRAQGLGLGMPYAKKIIEQHHGSIHVESSEGIGTRVEIQLPVSDR